MKATSRPFEPAKSFSAKRWPAASARAKFGAGVPSANMRDSFAAMRSPTSRRAPHRAPRRGARPDPRRRPGARYPRRAIPIVEFKACGPQGRFLIDAKLEEHLVRFDRMQEAPACSLCEAPRQGVGALGVASPDARLDVGEQLCRDVAGLREQLAGALAPQLEVAHQLGLEEHHRLGAERPVLGCAEAKHVDSRTPRDIAGMTPEVDERVRKACPIHLHVQSALVCNVAERCELGGSVCRAELGCLTDRYHRRLYAVHGNRMCIERRSQSRFFFNDAATTE